MFERFTDRARRVVVLAQEEARNLSHHYIGTEHLLLGVLSEGKLNDTVFEGLNLTEIRQEIVKVIGRGQSQPQGHIPFTPRSKRVLELSLREALSIGHNWIGIEHLVLGLLREGEGVGAQVLSHYVDDLNALKGKVLEGLSTAEAPARLVKSKSQLIGEQMQEVSTLLSVAASTLERTREALEVLRETTSEITETLEEPENDESDEDAV